MNPLKGLEIRPLKESDIPSVYAIESEVYDDPWSENLFHESLSAPMTYVLGLFRDDQELLAYAIYQVVYTEGHLLNIAVTKKEQSKGLGSAFLDHIMRKVVDQGGLTFFLEVRPSNERAKKIYEKKGFRFLMIREKYYSNNESAIIMVKDLVGLYE